MAEMENGNGDRVSKPSSTSLFQVYLRLRPPPQQPGLTQTLYPQLPSTERFLTVEEAEGDTVPHGLPTHITIHPPSDSRKRAVEKFAFTSVFEEPTSQLEVFTGTGAPSLVEGVLRGGRDGLIATLGVTGSGKSHTILGSKSQRGLTQLSLDMIYRSVEADILHPGSTPSLVPSLIASDCSEAQILSASAFLEGAYGEHTPATHLSRAATPMTVGDDNFSCADSSTSASHSGVGGGGEESCCEDEEETTKLLSKGSSHSVRGARSPKKAQLQQRRESPRKEWKLPFWNSPRVTRAKAKLRFGNIWQDITTTTSTVPPTPRRTPPVNPANLPKQPDVSNLAISPSANADFAVLVSMYEVYNDRIFDLLSQSRNAKEFRRRPLLFKSTEGSSDRKVVAGLKKIVCSSYDEAVMVLETGLVERRVAGTGSNSVSSRSHGFFCVELKKRAKGGLSNAWHGAQLTIVDLAGSERAKNAKTAGATLAEAGKINESLMYLGQCLQMQSDCVEGGKPSAVPFRQCKLTELLFTNSFPSTSHSHHHHFQPAHRNPQNAVMIVTADPVGDFNATSQILRYSALAREVTVPRIPSVTSMVFHGGIAAGNGTRSHPSGSHGRISPTSEDLGGELESATAAVSRLEDEVEILALRLAEETLRRREAEDGWRRAEERVESVEGEVREEVCAEMERRAEQERRRWMLALGEEADRNDAHVDRKLDIVTRGIENPEKLTMTAVHEDAPEATTNDRLVELEDENAALQRKIALLERQLLGRSPSKKSKKIGDGESLMLAEDPFSDEKENSVLKLSGLAINDQDNGLMVSKPLPKTPGRKIRKLTPKTNVGGSEAELIGTP